ncbi:MAG: DUF362 domain-containing protein [Clostridiaceae bacterium]
MSNVYFIPMKEYDDKKLSDAARKLLETVIEKEGVKLEEEVPLKVHFGEYGNDTYIKPAAFEGVIEYLKENNVKTRYIETNVLYRGKRTTRDSHIKTAKEHGFTNLPITIADGNHGEEFSDIKINGEIFDHVRLGKAYGDFKQFIILAHFKGHAEAGFGGAMKQLAMGFAARGGKLAQHSTLNPVVSQDACISCGSCVEACNYGAITLDDKAFINDSKCVGCAACVAVCPVGAIKTDWGARDFPKRVAEYAWGAAGGRPNIYICYIMNITEFCDCNGSHMEFVAENIGVAASTDPVSLDTACLEFIQKNENKDIFEAGRDALLHAEKIGFGSMKYNLITVK